MKCATFSMGCFWCVEPLFGAKEGVKLTKVGYTGGKEENGVDYDNLGGHSESIRVFFDENLISYDELLTIFFEGHYMFEPAMGKRYRSVIWYHSEDQRALAERVLANLIKASDKDVYTKIKPVGFWVDAEDEHQKHSLRNSGTGWAKLPLDFKSSPIATKLNGFVAGYGDSEFIEKYLDQNRLRLV